MTERVNEFKSTRRDVIKLAGAAALGVAGVAALGGTKVKAAGSGATLGMLFNPQHLTSGHLAAGAEVVIGPFPYPGQPPFDSTDYIGIVGNLTASRWKGNGWMSVRPSGSPFDPTHQAINLHFGGHFNGWSNWFICQFGFDNVVTGKQSDGKFIIRNGPAPTDYLVDLHGFMVGDGDL
jgi:hypothetical protein